MLLDATVLDGTGGPPVRHAVVVLERDRIIKVGPLSSVDVPDDALTIKLTGKWIVPGLVDAHIHMFQSAGLYTRPDILDLRRIHPYEHDAAALRQRIPETMRRYLASGITAVVDVGGPFWNFDVRDRQNATTLAPRLAVAGPLVSTVARPQLDAGDPPIIQAESPEQARSLVRRQLKRKPDLLKLWFIVPPKKDAEQLAGIIRAAIDEAHQGNVRVAVHATEHASALAAVEAGADILVHSVDDEPVDDRLLRLLRSRDVAYIPTLVVYEGYAEVLGQKVRLTDIERRYGDPRVIASWQDYAVLPSATPAREIAKRRAALEERMPIQRRNLDRVFRAGITIAAGTDAGNIGTPHGPALHRELELMVAAGMTPGAALTSATRNAARIFSKAPDFGTVEAGKLADLLVIDADPLADIRHLQRIHRVIKGGVVLAPPQILPANPAYVVQSQVDAYNARDLEGFVATFAPEVVVAEQPGDKEVARGHAELRAVYGKLFSANPELRCEVVQRIALGATVVDHELVTGIKGRPHVRAVARYEVKDGLIERVTLIREEPTPARPAPSSP